MDNPTMPELRLDRPITAKRAAKNTMQFPTHSSLKASHLQVYEEETFVKIRTPVFITLTKHIKHYLDCN